ncbi:hypothetical protein EJ04DRAFT_507422 [Polyplosphaeria fusca]|uniref:Dienelactone hydrolase domain-containing protein n=1 Tax=Polyplosphaeria fusca TaxID=682080 RepID=A0A9P4V7J6_9PLEO|nr:hypothetical protein EJ04DRAFT_507422 [Polyplosphaeria fusca]
MACPDCFRGGRATGDPVGELETIHGVKTYVAGTAASRTSQSTVIFYTDAFGLDLLNNKLLADAYVSATGFRVLVPDIIPGGAMSPDVMPIMDKALEPVSLFNVYGQLLRIYHIFHAVSYFGPFMWRAFPASKAAFQACLAFARDIKGELPDGAKLGAAGFCWGGFQSVNLAAQPATEGGTEPLLDASFAAHASALRVPDNIVDAVKTFKTPLSIAQARDDFALPTKKVEETEATLRESIGGGEGEGGYNYEFKYYDGCGHGFAVRAKPGSEAEAKGADAAKVQAIEWLKKFL